MPRLNAFRRPNRGLRRKTSWSGGPQSATGGAPSGDISTSAAVLGGIGSAAAQEAITVVRIRGQFLCYLTVAAAADEGFSGAVGIGLVKSPAFQAGVASVPTPITEDDDENWLWHQYFHLASSDIITGAASQDQDTVMALTAGFRAEIDSKAMRKMDSGDTLYCAVEVTEVGTCTMNWWLNCRVLAKLP